MIFGLLLSLIAGSLISVQNIFNSRVNERAGSWITTTLVLGLGFLASLIIGLILDGKHMFILQNMKTWYWFSGLIGVGIVSCVVKGMKHLGPTYAILIVLTSQLVFALLCDTYGWFGLVKVPISLKQIIGVMVIIAGIFVFKLNGERENQKLSRTTSQ